MAPMMKPNSKQFKVTDKDAEAPVLVRVEYQMMKEIGCSRSDLHKIAIREMHNRSSNQHYILFEVKMKNLQVPTITYEMARSLVKPMRVRNANDVAKALIEQELKKEDFDKWTHI